MRLVKITARVGLRDKVKATIFSAGIKKVTIHHVTSCLESGEERPVEVIDFESSTPKARLFIDKLLNEDYYDSSAISINVRQPRALLNDQDIHELTTPMVEPATDLYEELWQFSRVTYGLLGRIFISAVLLAYGLINAKLLIVIGGLLFLPVLPMIMAVSYGIAGRQWRLARQGGFAFVCSIAFLFAGGITIAYLSKTPMRSDDSGVPMVAGILISVAVGVAAALASIDDAGRREMIGLAAASQIGIAPVWLGITAILGSSPASSEHEISDRMISFGANLAALIITIMIVQLATGVIGNISKLRDGRAG